MGRRRVVAAARRAVNPMLRSTLAIAGAWLPIVFASAVVLPQHVEMLIDGPSWAPAYALVSAVGWLSALIGLIAGGYLRDRRAVWSGSERLLPGVLAAAVALGGLAASVTTTVPRLAVVWALALIPAGASVTLFADRVASLGRTQVASASAIGSAPLLALLIGSVGLVVFPVAGAQRFTLMGGIAAATLVLASVGTSVDPSSTRTDTVVIPDIGNPIVREAIGQHRRLLAAVGMVDTATVTMTFAIVPIVFQLPRDVMSMPGTFAEQLVLLATITAILSVFLAPRLTFTKQRPSRLFAASGMLAAGVLAIATSVSSQGLIVVAALAGVAVGASNAATFSLFLTTSASNQRRATGLGLVNAVPSLPAALIPVIALPLFAASPTYGLPILTVSAAVIAAVGALSAPRLAVR